MANRKHDIFLSYSSKDSETMQRVRKTLRESGFSVWVDETNLKPGTASWRTAIAEALESAGCLVVLFSPDAKKSRWVNAELEYAEHQGLTPFPILVRGSTKDAVPFGYTSAQWADITKKAQYDAEMDELVDSIRANLKDKAPAQLPPRPIQHTPAARPSAPAALGQSQPLTSPIDFKDIVQRQRVSPYFSRVASSNVGLGRAATPAPQLSFWEELWFGVQDFVLPWLFSTIIWLPLFLPMLAISSGRVSGYPEEISIPYMQDTTIATTQFATIMSVAVGVLWVLTVLMFEDFELGWLGGLAGGIGSGAACIGLGLLMNEQFDGDLVGVVLAGGALWIALAFGVASLTWSEFLSEIGEFPLFAGIGVALLAPAAVVVGGRGLPEGDLGTIIMFVLVYAGILLPILVLGTWLAVAIEDAPEKGPMTLLALVIALVAYGVLVWVYMLDGWEQFVV